MKPFARAPEAKLDSTHGFTVRMLRDVGRNPMAAASYASAIEGGGTPVNYVILGARERADYTDIVWLGPVAPWTVVIREGTGETELVVDAYGPDTNQPVKSETVDLGAGR